MQVSTTLAGMETPGPNDRWYQAFWVQLLLRALVVAAVVIVVVAVLRRDVVRGWRVVGACPAVEAPAEAALADAPDLSLCSAEAVESDRGAGRDVVPFVLPATAGVDADVTSIVAGRGGGELSMEFRDGTELAPYPYVLVFVELPSSEVPSTPFTTTAGAGTITVLGPP